MMTKIEMQAMDAIIGIHREMKRRMRLIGNNDDMRLQRNCSYIA